MITEGAKSPRQPRWTVGRVATDLAIIMVAVPAGLNSLALPVRGYCGNNPENGMAALGLLILAVRWSWVALKALNDAAERAADAWYPIQKLQGRKPQPLDDF